MTSNSSQPSSKLIEFPQGNFPRRNSEMVEPEWRENLRQQFRQIQEKRNRRTPASGTSESAPPEKRAAKAQIEPRAELRSLPGGKKPLDKRVADALSRIEKAGKYMDATRKTNSDETLAAPSMPETPAPSVKEKTERKLYAVNHSATQTQTLKTPTETPALASAQRVHRKRAQFTETPPVKVTPLSPPDAPTTVGEAVSATQTIQTLPLTERREVMENTALSETATVNLTPQVETVTASHGSTAVTLRADDLAVVRETTAMQDYSSATDSEYGELFDEVENYDITENPAHKVYLKRLNDFAPLTGRLVSSVADLFLICVLSVPFALLLTLATGTLSDIGKAFLLLFTSCITLLIYLTYTYSRQGRTWGQMLCSLHVENMDGGTPLTTRQSFIRAAIFALSLGFLGVPLLFVFLDVENRALHDHLSHSIVVRD